MKRKLLIALLYVFAAFSIKAQTTLLYEENFAAQPGDWTVLNITGNGAPQWAFNPENPRAGIPAHMAITVPTETNADSWLNSPLITFGVGSYEVSFAHNSQNILRYDVMLGTDPSDAESFAELLYSKSDGQNTGSNSPTVTITVEIETAGTYSIGFRATGDSEITLAPPTIVGVRSFKIEKIIHIYTGIIHHDAISGGMSSNGLLAAGSIGNYSGGGLYIWEPGQTSLFTDYAGTSLTVTDISNNGVVVGRFPDFAYPVPGYSESIPNSGYYKDGEWHSLGMLPEMLATELSYECGGSANFINSDATIIAGAMQVSLLNYRPVLWHLNGDGEYVPTILQSCETGYGDRLFSASEDGSVASGRAFPYRERTPAAWINGEYKPFRYNGMILRGYADGVSPNGKYIAIAIDDRATLYDVENDETIYIGSSSSSTASFLTSVSNNGIAVGYESSTTMSSIVNRAFIYSEKLGVEFIDNIEIATDIDAEGTRLTGYVQNGAAHIYDITHDFAAMRYRPQHVSLENAIPGEVVISWEAPKTEAGVTVASYDVYRNGAKINTAPVTGLSYTDTELTPRRYNYSVTAVYSNQEESKGTDLRFIDANGLRSLPFEEKFTEYLGTYSSTPLAQGWSSDTKVRERWGVNHNSGISAPCLSYSTPTSDYYNESIMTSFIDAIGETDIYLTFNIALSVKATAQDIFRVEVWDGENWNTAKEFDATMNTGSFTPQKIDISEWAANTITRIRFTATGGQTITNWYIDNIRVWNPENEYKSEAPVSVAAHRLDDGSVNIHWVQPNNKVNLSYIENESESKFISRKSETPLIAAIYFKEGELSGYEGYSLTSASGFFMQATTAAPQIRLVAIQNGERIYEQDITQINSVAWTHFEIDEPVLIDATKDLYLGFEVFDQTIIFLTYDDGIDGRANMVSQDNGTTWATTTSLLDNTYNKNLLIKGTLEKVGESTDIDPRIYGYRVYRNGQIINDMTKANNFRDLSAPETEITYSVATFYEDQTESESVEVTIDATSSIGKLNVANVSVYPNPANDFIYIEGEFTHVSISNLNGILVKSAINTNKIEVSELAPGIYTLSVEKTDGSIIKTKFIKK